jgi:hypothetical protein
LHSLNSVLSFLQNIMGKKNRARKAKKPQTSHSPTNTTLRIDQSSGKGLGVFATHLISKGDVVSSYPLMPADEKDKAGEYVLMIKDKRFTGKPWEGEVPCVVESSATQVAHLFNDGSVLTKRDLWPGLDKWGDDVVEYMKNTRDMCNVTHDDDGVFTATRDIAKDEEILFHYGALYWSYFHYGQEVFDLLLGTLEAPFDTIKTPPPPTFNNHSLMRARLASALTMPWLLRGMPSIPDYINITGDISKFACNPATPETTRAFQQQWKRFVKINEQVLGKIPIETEEKRASFAAMLLGHT